MRGNPHHLLHDEDDSKGHPRRRRGCCGGLCRATPVWMACVLLSVVGLCALFLASPGGSHHSGYAFFASQRGPGAPRGVVTIVDGDFVVRGGSLCEVIAPVGFNSFDIATVATVTPQEHRTVKHQTGRVALDRRLKDARAKGMNVLRTFVPDVTRANLAALDALLRAAERHGIRVILSLLDNWHYEGGVDSLVDASETAPARTQPRPTDDASGDFDWRGVTPEAKAYEVRRHALFFTDAGAQRLYRERVRTVVTRYRHDPTIFAWNLLNEPRCETWLVPECDDAMQAWVETMAAFVKDIDPEHLLTVGAEGFWAANAPHAEANPGEWAGQTGQNFSANHAPAAIDFATLHIWPDQWNQSSPDAMVEWVQAHAQASKGKPLILEEFGKKVVRGVKGGSRERDGEREEQADAERTRDAAYAQAHALVEASFESGGPLKGSIFWNWEMELLVGAKEDAYSLRDGDGALALVAEHAERMQSIARERSCDPHPTV